MDKEQKEVYMNFHGLVEEKKNRSRVVLITVDQCFQKYIIPVAYFFRRSNSIVEDGESQLMTLVVCAVSGNGYHSSYRSRLGSDIIVQRCFFHSSGQCTVFSCYGKRRVYMSVQGRMEMDISEKFYYEGR